MKITPKSYAESFLSLAEGADEKRVDTIAREFVAYFTKRGKTKLLRSIISQLGLLLAVRNGEQNIFVTVAKEQDNLLDLLKKSFDAFSGKKKQYTITVNPSIIGGMILEVDDIRVDASIAHQLRLLRAHIKA